MSIEWFLSDANFTPWLVEVVFLVSVICRSFGHREVHDEAYSELCQTSKIENGENSKRLEVVNCFHGSSYIFTMCSIENVWQGSS